MIDKIYGLLETTLKVAEISSFASHSTLNQFVALKRISLFRRGVTEKLKTQKTSNYDN